MKVMVEAKQPNLVISSLNLFVGAEGAISAVRTFPAPCCYFTFTPCPHTTSQGSQTADMRIIETESWIIRFGQTAAGADKLKMI